MGAVKRNFIRGAHSTPEEEIDRASERIYNQNARHIRDKPSYDQIIKEKILYEQGGKYQTKKQQNFFEKVFNHMQKTHPRRIQEGSLHQTAGGKNYQKDTQKTSKTIVKTRTEYIRQGATKTDLEGYDTRRLAKIKGKIVFATPTTITIKGKKITRYRDSKGRFTSTK